ncbi:hedgehog-interacting protein-like [Clavelina lepadiformis]|uniref:hedgehog-interacting protein-like n=1 Tax=Clavelina lepadiformis TaxID=159417 RepID=UPI004040FD37
MQGRLVLVVTFVFSLTLLDCYVTARKELLIDGENDQPQEYRPVAHWNRDSVDHHVDVTIFDAETDSNEKSRSDRFRVRSHSKRRNKKKKTLGKKEAKKRAQESAWYHCVNGKSPKEIFLSNSARGVMCYKEYPTHTCCLHHDLTLELIGSQISDQVQSIRCARLLMKLRCAHCSPRSWYLFNAPDKMSPPHKRMMPIMCPDFCRRFHRACRDHIEGLQNDKYCDQHISNEEGPCFPDYEIRRGTID